MTEEVTRTFVYGDQQIKLQTGVIARQASAAVMVTVNEKTSLLVTVVWAKDAKPEHDFLPLSVDYISKAYAAGNIPGGFFKREGRPPEDDTLTSRLLDRPLRPLFPKGFRNEVQVVLTLMSLDPAVDTTVPAMIGTSAAMAISGLPLQAILGGARIGYQTATGEFLLNPSASALAESDLDLVVAGTRDAILMVESKANQLPESVMLESVFFGHQAMQALISEVESFAADVQSANGWRVLDWKPSGVDEGLKRNILTPQFKTQVEACYQIQSKTERQQALSDLRAITLQAGLLLDFNDQEKPLTAQQKETRILSIFEGAERECVRHRVIKGLPRIDGRDTRTVRPIQIQPGLLGCTHGSALFTRGETQAIVVATLGTERDAQVIDAVEGERKDTFMLHYNFPPYSVGEIGRVGSPKRREIGHGRLARRAIEPVLPNQQSFPYVLRVVSEITESNGSSSMASVCGASLALMDAGVPLVAPVAGIAMGLIKENDDFAVLTDILGDEDHLGDMDFKVAGTHNGVTALQMDIKIGGITREIMTQALSQARDARFHILDKMQHVLPSHRADISPYAPRIITFKIDPEKIRDIIGKGGATIRALTEETGTSIDITDDGTIKIASVDQNAGLEARRRIELITADVEVGKTYSGRVVKILEFGAFVNVLPGKDGLVHISQISEQRIAQVQDVLSEGQSVQVKVMEIDRQGRIKLSIKAVEQEIVSSIGS